MDDNSFYKNMPKVELHLHIEGAIPIPALWELVKKYDSKKSVRTINDLKKRFAYTNFSHFIDTWIWKNTFIRDYEDVSFLASEVVKDLINQNYKYVEFFFTPLDHVKKGIEPQRMIESLYNGVRSYFDQIEINFIFDIGRDYGPENGMKVLHQMKEVKRFNLVGLGMGGREHLYPPGPFEKVYKKAKELGFQTTVHAGEAAGVESVWNAIKYLDPDRIGHGTTIIKDNNLIKFIRRKQIPIEACPISNIRTGVIKDLRSHPIKRYFDEGLIVFVNTDDPKMFNTSLDEEFKELVNNGIFSKTDIKSLLENAIKAAWCNDKKKNNLKKQLNNYYDM